MNNLITKVTVLALILTLTFISQSYSKRIVRSYSNRLVHKTSIDLQLGLRDLGINNNASVYPNYNYRSQFDDGMVSIGFNHWMQENMSFNFSVSVINAGRSNIYDSYYIDNRSINVVPIYGGIRFYLVDQRHPNSFRPYVSVVGGPVIRETNYNQLGEISYIDNYTDVVFGSKLSGGIDLILSRRMMFGINGGYNFISDFPYLDGEPDNYSGTELGISIGFLFGGGYR